jgi:sulfatase maturation enzyme AslB (radical SAM superfamily)
MDFIPVPITELLITSKCNMNCSYCFEKDKPQKTISKGMIDEFLLNLPSTGLMVFGGEPLLALDEFDYLYTSIQKLDINEDIKVDLLNSFTKDAQLITNGTLIIKNINIIKRLNLKLQISIDGPEEINDLCRVDHKGKGTYSTVIRNIKCCIANDIPWSCHGAIGRNNFSNLSKLFDFWWEICKLEAKGDLDKSIGMLGENTFQIIFEENYTDDDIDIFLREQEEIFNKIFLLPELNQQQKITLANNWYKRKGAVCTAGHFMYAYNLEGELFPCHRLAMIADKSNYNFFERGPKFFNAFLNMGKNKKMYSSTQNILDYNNSNNKYYQQNWCPSTNVQTSGTPYYQSCKYNVLIAEYGRFVDALFEYAHI